MKTKIFNLKITKKDLVKGDFNNPYGCPIARAMKKKGATFSKRDEEGVDGISIDFKYKGKKMRINGYDYRMFHCKVMGMKYEKKKEDCSVKLIANYQTQL